MTTQTIALPAAVESHVRRNLAVFAEYRTQIGLARGLGVKFGGGRRYVDDVRVNQGDKLRQAAASLRTFTRLAKTNGVNPSEVMRGLAG